MTMKGRKRRRVAGVRIEAGVAGATDRELGGKQGSRAAGEEGRLLGVMMMMRRRI
jgi:hypothetical protein